MLNSDSISLRDNEYSLSFQMLPRVIELTFSDKNLDRLSYSKMVFKNVDGTDELQDYLYKYKMKRKLPGKFAKNIIELENIIDMHYSKIDENIIEKLACLYKVLSILNLSERSGILCRNFFRENRIFL